MAKRIAFTEDQINEIIDLYTSGKSANKIGKLFGVSHTVITRIMDKKGLKRTYQESLDTARLSCNHDFFSCIDSEAKAYWLGFLYADGNVNDSKQPSLQICLSEKDSAHLEVFNKTLESEYNVGHYNYKNPVCQLRIPSPQIVKDLINLGCGPRKTFQIKPPTEQQVPNHLTRHFLRGYIDGDGCFTKTNALVILGTEEFLFWAGQQMPFEHHANPRPTKNIFRINLSYRSEHRHKALIKYLYDDATVYLERKYNKACVLL